MQPRAVQLDISIERMKLDRVAAFDAALFTAGLAAAMLPLPFGDLRRHGLALDGGQQRFALRHQQTQILRPLGRLLECSDFLAGAGDAPIVGNLEQDADTHGTPPIAGHCGK